MENLICDICGIEVATEEDLLTCDICGKSYCDMCEGWENPLICEECEEED